MGGSQAMSSQLSRSLQLRSLAAFLFAGHLFAPTFSFSFAPCSSPSATTTTLLASGSGSSASDDGNGNGNNDGHDVNHLLKLCYASSLSYLPLDAIASSDYAAGGVGGAHNLRPVAQVVEPRTESGATIFESDDGGDDALIVACRGSATPRNFATNLRFRLTPMNDRFGAGAALAHEGFQEAADGLWRELERNLLGGSISGGKKERKIIFTGHSLGAGTAEMCALHAASSSLSGKSGAVSEVSTFGGPRIGDQAFATYVNEEALAGATVRHVVHGADPILANNGPLWDRLGFHRSGVEVRCDPNEPKILRSDQDDVRVRMVPWNVIDHCKYLGIFVGPRLIK